MSPQILRAARLAPVLIASSALFAGSLGLATPAQATPGASVTVHVSAPTGFSATGVTVVLRCTGGPEDDPEFPDAGQCTDDQVELNVPESGTVTFPDVQDGTEYQVAMYDNRNPESLDAYFNDFVTEGITQSPIDAFALDPRCTDLPSATGTAAVGQTLSAAGGHFTYTEYVYNPETDSDEAVQRTDADGGTITYGWASAEADDPSFVNPIFPDDGDEPVSGASYTVTGNDQGTLIHAVANFESPDGATATCYSDESIDIPAATPEPDPTPAPVVIAPGTPVPGASTPAVSGKVKKGKKITAGIAVPAGATATYQWYRTFKKTVKHHKVTVVQAIAGATGPTYKLKGKDQGDKVFVVVTLTQPGYAATAVSSTPKKVK
ncbi:MAG: hypothetical protein JWO46_28 [Nocardioidaceae bacterium]|nr:hypothetical protein [Nocardioidaceae bacterium]